MLKREKYLIDAVKYYKDMTNKLNRKLKLYKQHYDVKLSLLSKPEMRYVWVICMIIISMVLKLIDFILICINFHSPRHDTQSTIEERKSTATFVDNSDKKKLSKTENIYQHEDSLLFSENENHDPNRVNSYKRIDSRLKDTSQIYAESLDEK